MGRGWTEDLNRLLADPDVDGVWRSRDGRATVAYSASSGDLFKVVIDDRTDYTDLSEVVLQELDAAGVVR